MSSTRLKLSGNTIGGYGGNGTSNAGAIFTFNSGDVTLNGSNGSADSNATLIVPKLMAYQVDVNVISNLNGSNINIGTGSRSSNLLSYYYDGKYGLDSNDAMYEMAVVGDVSSEGSRAQSAEGSLSVLQDTNVSSEGSRAQSAEGSLAGAGTDNISSEGSRAQSAEGSLSLLQDTNVSSEGSRAQSAEGSLSVLQDTNVSSEGSRAQSAEGSLSVLQDTNVSSEGSRAQSAEGSLSDRLTNFQTGAGGEGFSNLKAYSDYPTNSVETITLNGATGEVSSGSFTTTSDMRLKTDIATLSNALETITHLRPVEYNWISGAATLNPGHKEIGFLAQEVEAVLPNIISTHADSVLEGGRKTVAYDRVVAVLVGAIKELKADVDALKAKVFA